MERVVHEIDNKYDFVFFTVTYNTLLINTRYLCLIEIKICISFCETSFLPLYLKNMTILNILTTKLLIFLFYILLKEILLKLKV